MEHIRQPLWARQGGDDRSVSRSMTGAEEEYGIKDSTRATQERNELQEVPSAQEDRTKQQLGK